MPSRYLPFISIAFAIGLISYAGSSQIFFERGHPVNYTEPVEGKSYRGLKITESADKLGVRFSQPLVATGAKFQRYSNFVVPPALAVYDLNGDGFQDFVISGLKFPVVYLNENGRRFRVVSEGFGFDKIRANVASMVLFADLNNDGTSDVVVSGDPRHFVYFGRRVDRGLFFTPAFEKIPDYLSRPEAVNVLDFDQDGRLDLVFGNFVAKPGEGVSEELWLSAPRYDNRTGGKNDLLLQGSDGVFRRAESIDFLTRSYTHAVGISDFNHDGYPDIFIANDYAKDELFINENGRSIRDETRSRLPLSWHGNSGMNAEIVDYNQDGRPDIYVTNIYKPPFFNSVNLLWQQNDDGKFDAVSLDQGVAKCGFSWGAKFLDIDNDGDLDLAVTNGRNRSRHTQKENMRSLWYQRTLVARIPNLLRQFYYEKKFSEFGMSTSAYERDCLFVRRDGKFVDVAPYVGVTSEYEGRALAILDFDNDGRMDYIVANLMGPIEIFHNLSEAKGNWVGFELFDRRGSNLPIGAKITLKTKKGRRYVREYYPANGYRSQSDARLHFGLGDDQPDELSIVWPHGKTRSYLISQFNRYVRIHE